MGDTPTTYFPLYKERESLVNAAYSNLKGSVAQPGTEIYFDESYEQRISRYRIELNQMVGHMSNAGLRLSEMGDVFIDQFHTLVKAVQSYDIDKKISNLRMF